MSVSGKTLTRAQEEALDARDAVLDRALTEIRGIRIPEFDVDEEGDLSCYRCDCERFRQPASPSTSGLICANPTCRHGHFSHRVR